MHGVENLLKRKAIIKINRNQNNDELRFANVYHLFNTILKNFTYFYKITQLPNNMYIYHFIQVQ